MSQDYSPALWLPAAGPDGPHSFAGHDPRRQWIILHGTAGGTSAPAIAAYFQTSPHSTHYVIGRDGMVVQCVAEADSAWANAPVEAGADAWWHAFPNPNHVTLTIEHVKPATDNSDLLTPAQAAASFALIKHLCDRWQIPPRRADAQGGITGHNSIDPQSRAHCPGPYPWDDLFAALKPPAPVAPAIPLPPGWTDDPAHGILLGPPVAAFNDQRFPVVRGFRQALLTQPGLFFALGAPIAAERQVANVGGDGQHGPGVTQFFELGALGWTPPANVFRLWTGLMLHREMPDA